MSHEGKWALVTGASRGIGRAIALELAKRKFNLLLNFRSNRAAAETVADEIKSLGVDFRFGQFDVTDADAVNTAYQAWSDEGIDISIIVNNAGVAKDASFPAMDQNQWQTVTRTTLDGFFNITQPLIMPMIRLKWGRIINIASVSGVMGNRGQANYSAAKAGLIGATRSLSLEVAKRGITVNAVAPGLIETDMIADAPIDMIKKQIPMRRLGRADEVASLVGYLVSDEAAYITGQTIEINGGLHT